MVNSQSIEEWLKRKGSAMSKFIIKRKSNAKLNNPILIEGLPGTGNVARIAVDYLIENLKAKEIMEIYSYSFPNSVFVTEENTVKLPSIKIYVYKNKKRDLLLLIGDIQPLNEIDSYKLAEKILSIAKSLGVKEVITLGGIGLDAVPSSPKVHAVVTNKRYLKKLKGKVILDGDKTFGFIVGAAGLLLGRGDLRGFNGIALLGETYAHPTHFGFKSSLEVLKVLSNYLNVDFSLKGLEKEVRAMDGKAKRSKKAKKDIQKVMRTFEGERLRYIG
jgi:uncharacterized protein (TIGR00162 family)